MTIIIADTRTGCSTRNVHFRNATSRQRMATRAAIKLPIRTKARSVQPIGFRYVRPVTSAQIEITFKTKQLLHMALSCKIVEINYGSNNYHDIIEKAHGKKHKHGVLTMPCSEKSSCYRPAPWGQCRLRSLYVIHWTSLMKFQNVSEMLRTCFRQFQNVSEMLR